MTYIIAEISANHNGSVVTAKKLIDNAKRAGCDAVKFQSWTPESLYAQSYLDANKEIYHDLLKHSLSIKKLRYLARYATDIDFICSVFSRQEADELEDVVDLYKIASMDLNNIRLLKHIASKKKPVILSAGMGTRREIMDAVEIITRWQVYPFTLLHCVSLYPPRYDQIGLEKMTTYNEIGYCFGYSDHTEGITVCLAAIALGATMIEKHFTLDKTMDGWDHKISADFEEMQSLVRQSKIIEQALKHVDIPDIESRKTMRRSAVATRDLKKGDKIKEADIIYRRPGTGLFDVVGKKLKQDVKKGYQIHVEDLR